MHVYVLLEAPVRQPFPRPLNPSERSGATEGWIFGVSSNKFEEREGSEMPFSEKSNEAKRYLSNLASILNIRIVTSCYLFNPVCYAFAEGNFNMSFENK